MDRETNEGSRQPLLQLFKMLRLNLEEEMNSHILTADCPLCNAKKTLIYTHNKSKKEEWRCTSCKQKGDFQTFVQVWNKKVNAIYPVVAETSREKRNLHPEPLTIKENQSPLWKENIAHWLLSLPSWNTLSTDKDPLLAQLLKRLSLRTEDIIQRKLPVYYNPSTQTIPTPDGKTIVAQKGIVFCAKDDQGKPTAVRIWTLSPSNHFTSTFLEGSAPAFCSLNTEEEIKEKDDPILIIDTFSELQAIHLLPFEKAIIGAWWNVKAVDQQKTLLKTLLKEKHFFLLSEGSRHLKLKPPPPSSRDAWNTFIEEVRNKLILANIYPILAKQNYQPVFLSSSRIAALRKNTTNQITFTY